MESELILQAPLRILFIVGYPATGRYRPLEFMRALLRRGHEVTVATLWESEEDRTALAGLATEGVRVLAERQTKWRSAWNMLRALPSGDPLQAHYSWNPRLNAQCSKLVAGGEFDVIHLEHLRAARYGLDIRHRPSAVVAANSSTIGRPPVVWDSVDCISYLFEQSSRLGRGFFARVITRFELPRTRRYEGQLVGQFDRVLATSPVDGQALEELGKAQGMETQPRVAVMPSGVDLEYYGPQAVEREQDHLVFLGRMRYHPNVAAVIWFCDEVLPLIWAERPAVRFTVVGSNPGPAVRALAANPRIAVTGTVPDVRPYLTQATALVAPMIYGVGIQSKVLEAMATATPVVCTPRAMAALEAQPGQDLLVADAPSDLAAAVLHLLGDAGLQRQLAQAGRRYAEAYHHWDLLGARLEQIYEQLL